MSLLGRISDTSEYLAARFVVALARALPAGAAPAFGTTLGATADRLGARRDIVRSQIAAAFPDRDENWVARTASGAYRHFGREAVEMARLRRDAGPALIEGTATDAATEDWIERMAGGEGVIAVSGHIGNWETGGAYLARRGVPLAPVVKRQRNARFDAWLVDAHRRLGMEPVYMANAAPSIPGLVARGRTAVLLADQDARGRGLVVPFLGRPASTFRGPARLALATGAPLVFVSAVREDDGYRVRCRTVRDTAADDEDAADELELTRRWVAMLEDEVRERPEQYFWFHRRWKSGAAAGRNDRTGAAVPKAAPSRHAETTLMNRENSP